MKNKKPLLGNRSYATPPQSILRNNLWPCILSPRCWNDGFGKVRIHRFLQCWTSWTSSTTAKTLASAAAANTTSSCASKASSSSPQPYYYATSPSSKNSSKQWKRQTLRRVAWSDSSSVLWGERMFFIGMSVLTEFIPFSSWKGRLVMGHVLGHTWGGREDQWE